MRVIAGTARGRPLKAPPGRATRPTSDRVREAMFSSLADDIPGATVLDLFAGTGALGIEALSRGAAMATFVEREPAVLEVLRDNVQRAGVDDRATIVRADAASFVRQAVSRPFGVVLCDPPYDHPFAGIVDLVGALAEGGGLTPAAVVVVERERRDPAVKDPGDLRGLLAVDRVRSYGDTVLVYLRSSSDDAPTKEI